MLDWIGGQPTLQPEVHSPLSNLQIRLSFDKYPQRRHVTGLIGCSCLFAQAHFYDGHKVTWHRNSLEAKGDLGVLDCRLHTQYSDGQPHIHWQGTSSRHFNGIKRADTRPACTARASEVHCHSPGSHMHTQDTDLIRVCRPILLVSSIPRCDVGKMRPSRDVGIQVHQAFHQGTDPAPPRRSVGMLCCVVCGSSSGLGSNLGLEEP
jgi:hypothetical protein